MKHLYSFYIFIIRVNQGFYLSLNEHTQHRIYRSVYSIWICLFASFVIPMAILIFCNYKVYKHDPAKQQQEQRLQDYHDEETRSSATILLCISITLFLCNVPRSIRHIYDGFYYHLKDCPPMGFWTYIWQYVTYAI